VQNLLTEPAIQTHIASKVTIAMGDSVNGARLIGVDSIPTYLAFFDAKLNAGIISSQAMQAVVGASVARRLNLSLGSPFYSTHGLEPGGSSHDDSPYSVTGILQPTGTVLDTLILTPIDSIWVAHEGKPRDFEEAQLLAQARDISAVLVQYRYPISAVALPALLEKTAPANMTVAAVAPQMQRLWLLFEPFYQLFLALSIVIAAFSAVSLILTARLTQGQRLHDLGILRMLGAKTGQLCGLLALESLLYWIAASALFLAIFLTAGVLVSNTIHLPYLQLVLMATPTAFIVMCLTLFLLLIAAALTGWRLLKQTPAAVLQER
jgi:putative ABC transport system permease protein